MGLTARLSFIFFVITTVTITSSEPSCENCCLSLYLDVLRKCLISLDLSRDLTKQRSQSQVKNTKKKKMIVTISNFAAHVVSSSLSSSSSSLSSSDVEIVVKLNFVNDLAKLNSSSVTFYLNASKL